MQNKSSFQHEISALLIVGPTLVLAGAVRAGLAVVMCGLLVFILSGEERAMPGLAILNVFSSVLK